MAIRSLAFMLLVILALFLYACQPEQATSTPDPNLVFRDDPADRVASTGTPQLVGFYATYCSECVALRPILYALEDEYDSRVDFVFLDSDNPANAAVKDRFRYVAHPYTLLITPDGTIIQRWYGHQSAADLRAVIDEYLASGG